MKILILASNPKKDLNLEGEIRDLQAVIERSRNRENLEVEIGYGVRPEDLQGLLLKHEPNIVHFCGHGTGKKGLVLENDTGSEKLVSTDALSNLFELCSQWVKCVLLNACYSEIQADAIVRHIDYAIGMNHEIRDDSAIAFATGFYQALGYGQSIQKSYKFGCNAIQLQISDRSNFRNHLSEEKRKVEVINTVETVAIPDYLKPTLKAKPNLIPHPDNSTTETQLRDILTQIDRALEAENTLQEGREQVTEKLSSYQKKSNSLSQCIKNKSPVIARLKTIVLISGVVLICGVLGFNISDNVILSDPRYSTLQELLKAKKWTEADYETALRMWEIAGKSSEQELNSEDFANFPCSDLEKIDNLWSKYSDGQFGFSVQTRIWQEVDHNLADFVDLVGWGRKKADGSFFYIGVNEPNFNLSDPTGKIPWHITYYGGSNNRRKSYISRILECGIN